MMQAGLTHTTFHLRSILTEIQLCHSTFMGEELNLSIAASLARFHCSLRFRHKNSLVVIVNTDRKRYFDIALPNHIFVQSTSNFSRRRHSLDRWRRRHSMRISHCRIFNRLFGSVRVMLSRGVTFRIFRNVSHENCWISWFSNIVCHIFFVRRAILLLVITRMNSIRIHNKPARAASAIKSVFFEITSKCHRCATLWTAVSPVASARTFMHRSTLRRYHRRRRRVGSR
mmetsp:Transcript_75223/g.218425  ORF Transcript_75223/g.218425 Transcript_75223/m.218425 type:complete len:228 (+) Transcript_75223:1290-1973(+)